MSDSDSTDSGQTFDPYASDYAAIHRKNLGFLGRNMAVFAEYKADIARVVAPASVRSILDFGCGIGTNLSPLRRLFPDCRMLGCDTSAESLDIARREHPDVEVMQIATPDELPRRVERVDMAFVSNVFHHIPPAERLAWAAALRKVVTTGVLMFEHNPFNPVTRHLVNTCPFDEDAVLLTTGDARRVLTGAGFGIGKLRYTLLTPFRIAPLIWIEKLLSPLPLGGQYYVWATP